MLSPSSLLAKDHDARHEYGRGGEYDESVVAAAAPGPACGNRNRTAYLRAKAISQIAMTIGEGSTYSVPGFSPGRPCCGGRARSPGEFPPRCRSRSTARQPDRRRRQLLSRPKNQRGHDDENQAAGIQNLETSSSAAACFRNTTAATTPKTRSRISQRGAASNPRVPFRVTETASNEKRAAATCRGPRFAIA